MITIIPVSIRRKIKEMEEKSNNNGLNLNAVLWVPKRPNSLQGAIPEHLDRNLFRKVLFPRWSFGDSKQGPSSQFNVNHWPTDVMKKYFLIIYSLPRKTM